MQKYDISLKLLLRRSCADFLRALTGGGSVERWLDVELPEVRNTRVDLLGETTDQELLHIELQSTNDPAMPLRMAEYCLRVYRLFGRFPRQMVLYAGDAPLRMQAELTGRNVTFRYEIADMRNFDGDQLLKSRHVGDNVIAILARFSDQRTAVRGILDRIVELGPGQREAALAQLLRISGLRGLEEAVEREARNMPILNDIMENKVLGREIKRGIQIGEERGIQIGEERGIQIGEERGIQIGESKILRLQIEARFGPIPDWADKQIRERTAEDIEVLSIRLLSAQSLEELLK